MCVIGQPEPVDSVLMFLSGYDTLEYYWVKATAVSMRLRILFVMLQSTDKLSGAIVGERQLHYLWTQSSSYLFSFSFLLSPPPLSMEQLSLSQLSNPMGEFWMPSSSLNPFLSASSEPRPAFKAMVQNRPFSGAFNEDPYNHLEVFEELCSSLVILGMTQVALRWKLCPFSLTERVEQWYTRTIGSMSCDWEEL